MTTQSMDPNPTDLETTLQQRADYIPLDSLFQETSQGGDLFKKVHRELTNRGLRTIVGPRGCGKTHMMRYAWLSCRDDKEKPFAVYVSFNRYFRLEPLLSSHPGAVQQFHSWVLACVMVSLLDSLSDWSISTDALKLPVELSLDSLRGFVSRVERNQPLDEDAKSVSDALSIELVQRLLGEARVATKRRFTVVLMDDAALTLTPEYLIEFLDIVRSLKAQEIAPKASVYPGTTEMSPRFHQGQDSIAIPVWICLEDPTYVEIMDGIARTRVRSFDQVPSDVRTMMRLAAFGIPRAYLTMLDEYQRGGFTTSQQGASKIIQDHLDARISEFRSLGTKVPKLASLVAAGEQVLEVVCKELKSFNEKLVARSEKQLTYGVNQEEITYLVERMFNLLIEAGLIYDNGSVKHGTPSRIYRRYIPHAAKLLSIRALGLSGHGGSMRQTIEAFELPSTKHPVRKSLQSLLSFDLSTLTLSLPKCGRCSTPRVTENQRFCHQCGAQLVDASAFSKCLETEIVNVPGLSEWQRGKIQEQLPLLRTLGDFLAKQDPAAALLSVRGFGARRTTRIVDVLNGFVDDYLS